LKEYASATSRMVRLTYISAGGKVCFTNGLLLTVYSVRYFAGNCKSRCSDSRTIFLSIGWDYKKNL